MDSVICTNVNNLVNLHCNLKSELNNLKSEIENNNELTIIDLENNNVKLGNLTADNITADNIKADNVNISEEINTIDIYCKNLYASNNVETENIKAENITTDDLTGDSINSSNIYSTYIESQTVAVTSDKKMKKNITKIKDERLNELTPVCFKYNNNDKKYVYGLIAQDVELIYPDMIHILKNGNKAIDYNQFISLLILKTNNIEERLISIEKNQESIKKFTGLLILAFFIILVLLFLPRDYLNLRFLLKVLTKK